MLFISLQGLFLCVAGIIATLCEKGQRRNVDSAVRRNLNSDSFLELTANVQGAEPLPSNSVHVLEALTSRNGISVSSNIYEEQLQHASTQNEQRPHWTQDAEGQLNCFQQPENSNGVFKSGAKQRRKSSRSKSTDNAQLQAFGDMKQDTKAACLDDDVVCSKQQSTDEVQGWDVASIISAQDNTDRCHAANALLSPQRHGSGSFIALQPEVRLTPVEEVHSRIKPDSRNSSLRSEQETIVNSQSLRHEMQLCIPKLVITKIKQRRGSREVETHKVRAVFSGEEGASIPMDQKRKRESGEESEHRHRKEGTVRILEYSMCSV